MNKHSTIGKRLLARLSADKKIPAFAWYCGKPDYICPASTNYITKLSILQLP
jgi:hypothetical protein